MLVNIMKRPLSSKALVGLYAVWFSLMGAMGIVFVTNHPGTEGLWGWLSFGLGNVMVFYTHAGKFNIERVKRPISDWGFRILFAVILVSHLVIITDMAGA